MPVASNPVQQYVVDEWAQVINNVWIDKKTKVCETIQDKHIWYGEDLDSMCHMSSVIANTEGCSPPPSFPFSLSLSVSLLIHKAPAQTELMCKSSVTEETEPCDKNTPNITSELTGASVVDVSHSLLLCTKRVTFIYSAERTV